MTRMPPPRFIADEVRAELARQRKRQHECAVVLGVGRQTMWRKLNAERWFTEEELTTLADWLGVPVTRFLPSKIRIAS